jgi:ParG
MGRALERLSGDSPDSRQCDADLHFIPGGELVPLRKGWKRMNINIRAELFSQFKSAVAAQGKTITQVLLEFVEDYVRKHAPRSLSRPRHSRGGQE